MRVDADLELGRHAQLISELESHLTEHPSRERAACQLMLALYRCGRQGTRWRSISAPAPTSPTELGLEPGPALKRSRRRSSNRHRRSTLGDHGASADEAFPSARSQRRRCRSADADNRPRARDRARCRAGWSDPASGW